MPIYSRESFVTLLPVVTAVARAAMALSCIRCIGVSLNNSRVEQ